MNGANSKKPDTYTAKVISLGRNTIPEELRILHNIKDGCFVTLKILEVREV